jgi:amidase
MQAESVNNVFGRTVNPMNRKVTSGGSSGGESALIAFGGSPLGVGTDIVSLIHNQGSNVMS